MPKTAIKVLDNMGGAIPSGAPQPFVLGTPIAVPVVATVATDDRAVAVPAPEPAPPSKKAKGE